MTNREWIETLDNHDFAESIFLATPQELCTTCPSRYGKGAMHCNGECEKGIEVWLGKEHKNETD